MVSDEQHHFQGNLQHEGLVSMQHTSQWRDTSRINICVHSVHKATSLQSRCHPHAKSLALPSLFQQAQACLSDLSVPCNATNWQCSTVTTWPSRLLQPGLGSGSTPQI